MLAAVITFLVAIGINVLSSLHSISDIKINENIKTFSMKVSADTSIDIGTKKIEDVFLNVFKKYFKDFKLKEKKTDADLELTFKIDEFTIKDIFGLEKKMEVNLLGKVSLKNNLSQEKNCEDEVFCEKFEIKYKDKDKKEENAKAVIEKYVENFIKNKLAEKD
jgi:hypothetical protein